MSKVLPGVERGTIEEMVNAETWMTGITAAKYFDVTVDDVAPAAACVSGYFEKYRNTPGLDTISGTLISAKADAESRKIRDELEAQIKKAHADEIGRVKDKFELLKLQSELDSI